jgi:hypothetical protein
MLKPPKSALLAAVVATGVACSGTDNAEIETIGKVAAPVDDIEEEPVGTEVGPERLLEDPGTIAAPDELVGQVADPQRVGATVAPRPRSDEIPSKPLVPPKTEALEK